MKRRDYFMLPNEIFSLGLKPRDFAVLACLIRHKDNENDSCYPSRELISKECCIKIWMYPEIKAKVKEMYHQDDCRSMSEFVEKSIRFYVGYLTAENKTNYLPKG